MEKLVLKHEIKPGQRVTVSGKYIGKRTGVIKSIKGNRLIGKRRLLIKFDGAYMYFSPIWIREDKIILDV